MNERKAIEKVVGRLYKERLRQTGRLPDVRETKVMENKAREAAKRADRENKRG